MMSLYINDVTSKRTYNKGEKNVNNYSKRDDEKPETLVKGEEEYIWKKTKFKRKRKR